ncbi:OB-fold domain-containing protein [Agromyces bauzanensis]
MTSRTGVVYAATTIHVGMPGHEPPYTLAYVDVDVDVDGQRVLAPVDRGVTVGEHVSLVDDPASATGVAAKHGGRA